MRRHFILFLVIVSVLVSCKPKEQLSTSSNSDIEHVKDTSTVYITMTKDSVLIRDSIVMRPDGSVDRWHKEKVSSLNISYQVIRIRERLNITKTLSITKTIYKIEKVPWYNKMFIWIGRFSSLGIVLLLIYLFVLVKLK
jgi:hypothetical protein